MKDAQLQAMSLARHNKILARVRAAQPPAEAFAVPEPSRPQHKATTTTAPTPAPQAPEPIRAMVTARPARVAEPPQLSTDQIALLAASLGAEPPPAPASADPPNPSEPRLATLANEGGAAPADMSEAQLATLMAAFGQDAPAAQPASPAADSALPAEQTVAAMAATAIPQARDENLRYFPVNRERQTAEAARMTAGDTYLRAIQQMERNLGAYGGLARNGR